MPKSRTHPPSRRATRARKRAEARRRRARTVITAIGVAGVVLVAVILATPAPAVTYPALVATGTITLTNPPGGPSETLKIGAHTTSCSRTAGLGVTGSAATGTYTTLFYSAFDHKDRFNRWWHMVAQLSTTTVGDYTGGANPTNLMTSKVSLTISAFNQGGTGTPEPPNPCTQGLDLDCVMETTAMTISGSVNSADVTTLSAGKTVTLISNTSKMRSVGGECGSSTWKEFVCSCGGGSAKINEFTLTT